MEQALRDVGIFVVALVVGVGPVALLIGLLNRRDRREAALLRAACAAFSAQALRSDVAVRVHSDLLTRRGVVTVDLRACTPAEFWEAMTRLRQGLPPSARLMLEGTVGRAVHTRLTVDRVDAPRELSGAPLGRLAA